MYKAGFKILAYLTKFLQLTQEILGKIHRVLDIWSNFMAFTFHKIRIVSTVFIIIIIIIIIITFVNKTRVVQKRQACQGTPSTVITHPIGLYLTLCPWAAPSGIMFTNQIQTSWMRYNYYM